MEAGERGFRSTRSLEGFLSQIIHGTLGQLRAKTPRHRFKLVPVRTVLARGFSDLAGKSFQLLILRGELEILLREHRLGDRSPGFAFFTVNIRYMMPLCGASVNHA